MLYQTDNPHGGDIYNRSVKLDFSSNTNPLGTPESVCQAVRESIRFLNRYPDPCCRELIAAISRYEQVPEEYVLCGCGAAELIFSYCNAVRPHKALELAPTFSEYSAALEAVGCHVERYPLREEADFSLDGAFLNFLKAGQWDVLFLCNPNNPTGVVIDPALLRGILTICREKGVRLFVDECFLDLSDCPAEQSLKDQLADHRELFILKAFTKNYAMAGLRLGYCLTGDAKLLRAMGRMTQPWNVSLPAQRAGVAALKEVEFLNEARQLIQSERSWLQAQLRHLGIRVVASQANYLLLYSPRPLKEMLLEQGILIRDCGNYRGLGGGWYRIAVKRHEENEMLIAAMKGAYHG